MKKIHKLDLILLVGIGLIAIVSALIDIFHVVVFPVCSCTSVFYISYPLWIMLLIYSSIKYKDKEEQESPNMSSGLCCFFYRFYILRLL